MDTISASEQRKRRKNRSLAGVTVIVTRPAGDARAALAAARARGATAIALPGMRLCSMGSDAALCARLDVAKTADLWIFTSPAAVRFAFATGFSPASIAGRLVVVPGDGTRRALARHGINAIAPVERTDSEGVLALPQLDDVSGRRAILVGAPGGRDMIGPALSARGATVESIDIYTRMAPRLGKAHLAAFAAAAPPIVTVLSSTLALTHLLAALPDAAQARWRALTLVVSSARLARIAASQGFDDVHVAATAAMPDLLDAAEHAIARHRL